MGLPTGISSEDCSLIPPTLLDDSAISEGVAAAGTPSSTTRLCLGATPGPQIKGKDIRQQKLRVRQKPPDWLPDIVASPSLLHNCPRLLGTTSAGFGSRTPLTSQRFDSSRLTLHQVYKGSTIIGVRNRQSLQNSWIQIGPIVMRLQMSPRRHMARPMNLWQRRITPIDQQIILQKDPEFWQIIHMFWRRIVQNHPML